MTDKQHPFTGLRDFTDMPASLEAEIDSGNMLALVTFYKLRSGTLGMMNGGFQPEALFDVVCELRRTMIATMNMVDADETEAIRRLRAELADALKAAP